MTYLFDTNIVLALLRQRSTISQFVSKLLTLTDDNRVVVSLVTIGELYSIANQNQWGLKKRQQLKVILDEYIQVAINDDELLIQYAEIDAFSQDKLPDRPLGMSARNMGKNDLWIVATASLMEATLITTDKDFDHLHQQFVEVIWLDPKTV